jgi:two-component system cell cycle sensor histidine kinase/response regulator CckA
MSSRSHLRYIRHLEAFRKLSEEVVHDINNLLSGILGYSELLLLEAAADQNRIPAEGISNAGKRIASLTRILSAFGNKYTCCPAIMDLNEVILAMEGIISRIFAGRMEFVIHKISELYPIKADPVKMKQAFITLAIEMSTLMRQGGKLTIFARNLMDARALPQGTQLKPGPYVCVTATSSGIIAADAALESLLVKPSTPDDSSEGMGYELPSVGDLFKLANGQLILDSCSDRELSISIYIPAASSAPDIRV